MIGHTNNYKQTESITLTLSLLGYLCKVKDSKLKTADTKSAQYGYGDQTTELKVEFPILSF